MKISVFRTLWCPLFVGSAVVAMPASNDTPAYTDPALPLEQQVDDLLGRLTLEEKVSLLSGGTPFGTKAIERVVIPALDFNDGPAGVRSNNSDPTLAYPVGIALASTWNPALVQEVGAAIGRDGRTNGAEVVLAPSVNIQRVPLAGRNFEAYSEDPYLSGAIGIGYVRGLQGEGIGASVKHFVGNEQELERMRGSSLIGERALREIYLRPFEMIVKEAEPWTVMCAYNRVNGAYMSQHRHLLRDILKEEWGFDGLVMSDWGAVHATVEPVPAGLDLEMPGPPKFLGDRLVEAVKNWQVEEREIDDAARRVLRLVLRTGALDGETKARTTDSDGRNRRIALQAAEEGIVLLKNDGGFLPLRTAALKSLAVIGPNADFALSGGGGSSKVVPSRMVTPVESLRSLVPEGVQITYAKGVDNDTSAPVAQPQHFSPTLERAESGLTISYFANADFSGEPVKTAIDTWFDKKGFGAEVLMRQPQPPMSVRWEGYFWPPEDGEYEFKLWGYGRGQLEMDGKPVFVGKPPLDGAPEATWLPLARSQTVKVPLQAGQPVAVKLEYTKSVQEWPLFNFGVRQPSPLLEEAVAVARSADVAVVFVGASSTSDTEGHDRSSLELFGRQNELVEAVVAANPRTIVVLQSGGPMELPWNEKVPALLQAWFPGQEGSDAIARILLGEVSPSGRLPVTLPRRLEDNPTYLYYGPGRDAEYGEGVFVGYRYYDKKQVEPLYPFGHGLSYETFTYSELKAPEQVALGQPVEFTVVVVNTSEVAGSEVVQVYVGDIGARAVSRPPRELRAFQKVQLEPGESKTLTFTLTGRDFAYYDVHQKTWVAEPGRYVIAVGSSSRDIRLQQEVSLTAAS